MCEVLTDSRLTVSSMCGYITNTSIFLHWLNFAGLTVHRKTLLKLILG